MFTELLELRNEIKKQMTESALNNSVEFCRLSDLLKAIDETIVRKLNEL